MPYASRQPSHRPRELRRRVVIPARLRSGCGWTDACILNISSRGLLIHSALTGPQGSTVELRRGDYVIVARVVWQDGARAGLCAEELLPVHEMLRFNPSAVILAASDKVPLDPRSLKRRRTDRRAQGARIEFAGVMLIVCSLAATAFMMIEQALQAPMAAVRAALGA
jgi:hypothetical protein